MKNLLLSILITMAALNTYSQDDFCEAIVVQGKSKISLSPDIVTFQISLSVEDSSFSICTELALQKIEDIKTQFKLNDLDTNLIKTIKYSIQENKEYDNRLREHVMSGYIARIPVFIKTNIKDPETARIFEIIGKNFNSDLRINFELSESQINKIKEELISLAIEDAKSKAEIIAKNAKIKLGKITKIQYGEPQEIRNFTHANYDLVSSVQLTAATSRVGFNSLTPMDIVMKTNVMLAWSIRYD